MDANQTIRDLTIAYIENALTEVALLHDEELIQPMLEKFHIERHYARFHGFAPKPGKFNPRAGLKPRPVYTVTDANGTPLGDPIHEGDLGARYAEALIMQQIAANLAAMLADHADLVALHRAGDGGAAPSFRYKPASSLAERTDTEATLEQQKTILRTQIEKLHDEQQVKQQRLNAICSQIEEAEAKLDAATRKMRHKLAQMNEAQKLIDRAARIRQINALKQGEIPSPWDDNPEQNDDPELG